MEKWQKNIQAWRNLPEEEKHRRRTRSIPHSVAASMAFEGEPVSEVYLRARMAAEHPEYFPEYLANPPATVRFALCRNARPRIEETVRVGEWLRRAVISRASRELGADRVPALLSGHGLRAENRHGHAFYLPEDADGDGCIDHLLVHVTEGLSPKIVRVLGSVSRLWNSDDEALVLSLMALGEAEVVSSGSVLCCQSKTWISTTPYLHPWYAKKGFGYPERIRRECGARGLPEPREILFTPETEAGGEQLSTVRFRRFRSKRGLVQPDRQGVFARLEFADSVCGPLALGFGCHFGLGLFRPVV